MKKRRTDIAKLVSAARNVWRFSANYNEVKKLAKKKSGWYQCCKCKRLTEKPKVDHIDAIGRQPISMFEFGTWLERLFAPVEATQVLCSECHKVKTKEDRKTMKRGMK